MRGSILDHKLLSLEEQQALGRVMEIGHAAEARLAKPKAKLSTTVRRQLEQEVVAGQEARQEFITANLRLVVYCARKMAPVRDGGEDAYDEAIQDGTIGLCKAVDRWDWRRGFTFATYAAWWIRKELTQGGKKSGTTRATSSAHGREVNGHLRQAEEELLATLHRSPTDAELAGALGFSAEQVRIWRIPSPESMDSAIRRNGDQFSAGSGEDAMDKAVEAIVHETVGSALEKLSPAERDVVRARFGFDDGNPKSFPECGKALGISQWKAQTLLQTATKHLGGSEGLGCLGGMV
jgi:RNA polymerase primary sigma factor